MKTISWFYKLDIFGKLNIYDLNALIFQNDYQAQKSKKSAKRLLCLDRMQKACLIFVSVVKCGVHHSYQAVSLTVQIEP